MEDDVVETTQINIVPAATTPTPTVLTPTPPKSATAQELHEFITQQQRWEATLTKYADSLLVRKHRLHLHNQELITHNKELITRSEELQGALEAKDVQFVALKLEYTYALLDLAEARAALRDRDARFQALQEQMARQQAEIAALKAENSLLQFKGRTTGHTQLPPIRRVSPKCAPRRVGVLGKPQPPRPVWPVQQRGRVVPRVGRC